MSASITCNMSGQIVRLSQRDSRGRAMCPICGKWYAPTKDGNFRYHMKPTA